MARDLTALVGHVVEVGEPGECTDALTEWLRPIAEERVCMTGRLTIALSGGQSPIQLFTQWRTEHTAAALHLDRWVIFSVDDRAVAAEDPASNAGLIRRELLEPLHGTQPTFYPLDGGAEDLTAAATAYGALLDELLDHDDAGLPVLDVVICGLGDDGHTASLFPGSDALTVDDQSVVRAIAPVAPVERLTLTFPVLNAARHLAVFAPGANKETAFAETAAGTTPAARLRNSDQWWFIDRPVNEAP